MVVESRTVVSVPRSEESLLPVVSVVGQIYLRADEHDLTVEYEHSAVVADIVVHYWTTYAIYILHMITARLRNISFSSYRYHIVCP